MLTAIETTATIGANRQLTLDEDLPENVSAKVRVIVLFSEEDYNESEWLRAASKNDAFDFLNDEAEDIYTLEDGKPLSK
ncbi:MAG: hypothetical protein M3033_08905 [Acidobacteriota bacterium]|nr:hypothetical protein [Acidobacteriota bacterium]